MNLQRPDSDGAIHWTRVYGRSGYTWNFVTGCPHGCEWIINSQRVKCYAKRMAESRRLAKHYPGGFDNMLFHPKRLKEPLSVKEGAGIFISSMGDLFAAGSQEEWIDAGFEICRQTPQHIYFVLTKNPARMFQYMRTHDVPKNIWIGVSSPADYMNGRRMTQEIKQIWVAQVMRDLATLRHNGYTTFMSVEPLSWDVAAALDGLTDALSWIIIGGASVTSRRTVQPEEKFLHSLHEVIGDIPVFHKHNLRIENPRKEFPGNE